MSQRKNAAKGRSLLDFIRPFWVTLLLFIGIIGIVFLANTVMRELKGLEVLSADRTQWSMVQTEVETLRLQVAVEVAIAEGVTADMAVIRRWFDVLYSRVSTLTQNKSYMATLSLPEFAQNIARMQAFLDRTVPVIDGPDDELRAALPYLSEMLPEIRQAARQLALKTRISAANSSDTQRATVIRTLIKLAVLTGLLFLSLGGLSLVLLRLIRNSREQVRQNSLTSARLQTIFSTSADAIVVTNRGGWIVDINPAAEAMFGHTREKAFGNHALELLLPPDLAASQSQEITSVLERAAKRKQGNEDGPLRIELFGMRADGTRIPVEMSMGTMQVASGGVIVALVRDISDRRLAEASLTEALQKAQAGERAKADFIAVMSHEMRTPLNGLLGTLEVLSGTDLQADQKDMAAVMASSGQILLQHVNSVLNLSKAEANFDSTVLVNFDFDQMIEDCVANQTDLASAKGLTIRYVPLNGPLGWVSGNPSKLQQILLNLIGNAVKFTVKGQITVEAERDAYGQIVEIRVIDTGIGILDADLDRVFEDFVTLDTRYDRQSGGSGLGLGIARRIARAMGGEIGLESVIDDGSVFWVRLPLPAGEQLINLPSTAASAKVAKQASAGLEVLIIEDNAVNRFVLRKLLEEQGHKVTEAENGLIGVAAAMAQRFDLILTDISMPGLDGIEVTRRIRSQKGASQTARVVAVTAHASPADLDRFRNAGLDDCLTKPITRAELAAMMADTGNWAAQSFTDKILDPSHIHDFETQLGAAATATLITRVIEEGDAVDADKLWSGPPGSEKILHSLAGTAGTIGAASLHARLAALNVATANHDVVEMARLADGFSPLWQSTRSSLEAEATRLLSGQSISAAGA